MTTNMISAQSILYARTFTCQGAVLQVQYIVPIRRHLETHVGLIIDDSKFRETLTLTLKLETTR